MIVLALVSRIDSITSFPDEFKTAIETVSLCTSIQIYLALSIQGAPFGRVDANTQNLLPRSALLYCVALSSCGPKCGKALRLRIAARDRIGSLLLLEGS